MAASTKQCILVVRSPLVWIKLHNGKDPCITHCCVDAVIWQFFFGGGFAFNPLGEWKKWMCIPSFRLYAYELLDERLDHKQGFSDFKNRYCGQLSYSNDWLKNRVLVQAMSFCIKPKAGCRHSVVVGCLDMHLRSMHTSVCGCLWVYSIYIITV